MKLPALSGFKPKDAELAELLRRLKDDLARVSIGGGVSGDMFKAVYDADRDDVVDNAKRLNGHTSDEFALASHSHTESDLSFSDVTTGDVSAAKHGFCPKLPNDGSKFLDGTGSWSAVGDILEFVYDPDYQCLVVE